ncbi:GNAT family N-acetyltransferase [Patescibacteria group bacterium]|nr:GNAT family N-acetyltransferase [Patescibacteria group bacterium]MBU2036491.1 GNAT family N-acetyltransferase [Patescibacteria group bacterium]
MTREMGSKSTENDPEMLKTLDFVVYKPGGNDTGLFQGVITDVAKRKTIADALLKEYPNVEQVGFVNLDPNNTELIMTGGEFCGNATRSTAYAALKGEPGELTIKVSGVKNKLRAGVAKNGEAFSQMPIYKEVSRITPDTEVKGNVTVEMEGITHYVDFNPEQIKSLSEAEIKAKARAEMKRRGIDKGPACGIIYAEKKGANWEIYPVVYVRDADTLYYETACGSGTTALGLTLALKEGKSINNIPIIQPSGTAIKFSVEFDGKEFGYAQIQGSVQKLAEGEQIIEKEGSYAVEQITDYDKLEIALNKQDLIQLYKDIFSKPPYYENFSDADVTSFFKKYLDGGKLFLAYDQGKVVGFGASQPIKDVPEIEKIIRDVGVDTTGIWYMADLGVDEKYRGRGIAKKLVQKRIDSAPEGNKILMRTSVDNVVSQTLYRSLGFKDVPNAFQYVPSPKKEIQIKDKRLFLIRDRDNF